MTTHSNLRWTWFKKTFCNLPPYGSKCWEVQVGYFEEILNHAEHSNTNQIIEGAWQVVRNQAEEVKPEPSKETSVRFRSDGMGGVLKL